MKHISKKSCISSSITLNFWHLAMKLRCTLHFPESIPSLISFSQRLPAPIQENRRKTVDANVPSFVYSRAEDIQGYEKFTLDEVIYPQKVIKSYCPQIRWGRNRNH